MLRLTEIKLTADRVFNARSDAKPDLSFAPAAAPGRADVLDLPNLLALLRPAVATALGLAPETIESLHVHKQSFDARKPELLAAFIVDVALVDAEEEDAILARHAGNPRIGRAPDMRYRLPAPAANLAARPQAPALRPVVIGFGPCGIFCALLLAQMGLRPIVLERGKAVRERTKDTWRFWRRGVLDAESNVQFGEGGAGTFSDGKLYSQVKDPRFLGRKVIEEFVKAGAPPEILVDAHPHIGTFRLVKVVQALRAQIVALGGEVRFGQRVIDLLIERDGGDVSAPGRLRGLVVQDQASDARHELRCDAAVLALGHSARDTFEQLHACGVAIEAKPFSIGFRIEHPQGLVDRARWGRHAGHPLLGAAEYRLVHHAENGRTVYSFCMCPGGTVVAATSEVGRVATNGMSQYSRNERNANAGIVVGIEPRDFPDRQGDRPAAKAGQQYGGATASPLAGMALQRALESRAFELGGRNYHAPVQLVGDFVAGRASTSLASVRPSYTPGVKPTDLAEALPAYAIAAIREALPVFGTKIKGFDALDAVLTGVETRTSSPIRIARGDDCQSVNVRGLYPAGEGAGYAGGILSAGIDGIKVAEAVAGQSGAAAR